MVKIPNRQSYTKKVGNLNPNNINLVILILGHLHLLAPTELSKGWMLWTHCALARGGMEQSPTIGQGGQQKLLSTSSTRPSIAPPELHSSLYPPPPPPLPHYKSTIGHNLDASATTEGRSVHGKLLGKLFIILGPALLKSLNGLQWGSF